MVMFSFFLVAISLLSNSTFDDVSHHDYIVSDNTYKIQDYSDLNVIYLRKNLVKDVNTLTQAMLNQANTVYVIQYDYKLGEDVTLPANCILYFREGSFRHGKLKGQSSQIIVEGTKPVFENIEIRGTFKDLKISFFKRKTIAELDFCIKHSLNTIIDGEEEVISINKYYSFPRSNKILKNLKISFEVGAYLILSSVNDVEFENIVFDGNKNNVQRGITIENSSNVKFSNCKIANFGNGTIDCVFAVVLRGDSKNFIFINSLVENIRANNDVAGIVISPDIKDDTKNIYNAIITNSEFKDIIGKDDADGIKILCYKAGSLIESYSLYSRFENLVFDNCGKRGLKLQCSDVQIKNIICRNSGFRAALIGVMGDNINIDGLIGIDLQNESFTGIRCENYKNMSISNVHLNHGVKPFPRGASIYDNSVLKNSTLKLYNVTADYPLFIRVERNEGNKVLEMENCCAILHYNYLVGGSVAYDKVVIKNLDVDHSELGFHHTFQKQPTTLISD